MASRISDLLSIKFDDIHDDRLLVHESKTGKLANIQLNNKALTTIKQIRIKHPTHIYQFQSYRNHEAINKAFKTINKLEVTLYIKFPTI